MHLDAFTDKNGMAFQNWKKIQEARMSRLGKLRIFFMIKTRNDKQDFKWGKNKPKPASPLHAGLNFTAKQIKKFWYLKKLCNQNSTTERDFVVWWRKYRVCVCGGGPPTWNHDIVWVTQFEINELEFGIRIVYIVRLCHNEPTPLYYTHSNAHIPDFELPNYAILCPPHT